MQNFHQALFFAPRNELGATIPFGLPLSVFLFKYTSNKSHSECVQTFINPQKMFAINEQGNYANNIQWYDLRIE